MPEGVLFGMKGSKFSIISKIVLSGHDLDARGSAQRLGVAVREPDSGLGEFIKMRRLIGEAAVAAQALVAEVIGHYQNDVGFLPLRMLYERERGQTQ